MHGGEPTVQTEMEMLRMIRGFQSSNQSAEINQSSSINGINFFEINFQGLPSGE